VCSKVFSAVIIMTLASALHLPHRTLDFNNGFVITYEYHYVHPVTNDIHGLTHCHTPGLLRYKSKQLPLLQVYAASSV
jgi:hypothetical protein